MGSTGEASGEGPLAARGVGERQGIGVNRRDSNPGAGKGCQRLADGITVENGEVTRSVVDRVARVFTASLISSGFSE